MARATNVTRPQAPELSRQQIEAAAGKLRQRIERINAFQITTSTDRDNCPALDQIEADVDDLLVRLFGHGTVEYYRYHPAASWDRGSYNTVYSTPQHEIMRGLQASKERAVALLEQAESSMRERADDLRLEDSSLPAVRQPQTFSTSVFVVHGHDGGARSEVARCLQTLGLQPIILHEQASGGRTIIEKIIYHSDVGFAVVVLTPDDSGSAKGLDPQPRARQNVILELGLFIGKLGRDRVCALRRGTLELPSDFEGVVYTDLDHGGAWKFSLARELRNAGYKVDMNRLA